MQTFISLYFAHGCRTENNILLYR